MVPRSRISKYALRTRRKYLFVLPLLSVRAYGGGHGPCWPDCFGGYKLRRAGHGEYGYVVRFQCNSTPSHSYAEVFAKYGSPEQQKKWLVPLLNGEIRSAFAMTERFGVYPLSCDQLHAI